jgi:hypothetical protein
MNGFTFQNEITSGARYVSEPLANRSTSPTVRMGASGPPREREYSALEADVRLREAAEQCLRELVHILAGLLRHFSEACPQRGVNGDGGCIGHGPCFR